MSSWLGNLLKIRLCLDKEFGGGDEKLEYFVIECSFIYLFLGVIYILVWMLCRIFVGYILFPLKMKNLK